MSDYAYRRRKRTKFFHHCYNSRNFKTLPHAIDPEDVSRLLFVIKKIRILYFGISFKVFPGGLSGWYS